MLQYLYHKQMFYCDILKMITCDQNWINVNMAPQVSNNPENRDASEFPLLSRRRFLIYSSAVVASLVANPLFAASKQPPERSLSLRNLHTGEKLTATYWADGEYLADGRDEIEQLLRDHRTGEQHQIDPQLLDLLYSLNCNTGTCKPFHVISGYRSPKTNNMLRGNSGGVAKRSLHMQGKAIDIRIPGYDLRQLRRAAISLKAGGVGYYPKSDFVHVDTGRVRYW
jgi:uncharacterized protein YcbK (DUF882 family)